MSDAVRTEPDRLRQLQRILHARVARRHAPAGCRSARHRLAGGRHRERGRHAERRPTAAGQGPPVHAARIARRQCRAGSAPSPAAASRLSTWRLTTITASTCRWPANCARASTCPGGCSASIAPPRKLVPGLFSRNERVFCGFDSRRHALGHHPGRRAQCRQHGHGVARRRHAAQASRGDRAARDRCAGAGHPGKGRRDGALQHGLDRHPVAAARRRRLERVAGRRPDAAHGRTHRHLAGWPRAIGEPWSADATAWRPTASLSSLRRRAQALRQRANSFASAACSKWKRRR